MKKPALKNGGVVAAAAMTSLAGPGALGADSFTPNYEEALVGNVPIPEVLARADGGRVASREEWLEKQRPELLKLFAGEMYGRTPGGAAAEMRFEVLDENRHALGGRATMRRVALHFGAEGPAMAEILLYFPNEGGKPAPVLVGLNFRGNHAVSDDPAIPLSTAWFRDNEEKGYVNNRATEASRGSSRDAWPLDMIISRGYGLATAYYGDFDPDFDDGFQNGVHPLFYQEGRKRPAGDEWGAIGAWAWGLSRMADYLETLPEVDRTKLAVLGHSRLGKAALWAGAQDERFGLVISNNSGAGGAALSKRNYGETVERLNHTFPHWFCGNFKKYNRNEAALPMDQHQLIALMAPRPVYIASATEDRWADPKGEFLGGKLAEPVYALFGRKGLGVEEPPAPDVSVGESIGYHCRTGKHQLTAFDWERYLDFADKHWGKPGPE